MASDPSFIDHVSAQVGLGRELTHRRMFGEYALYLDGKVVAFVCDNQLYVKPTEPGRAVLGEVSEHAPFPGAKLYFRIDDELDQRELMQRVLRATALAVPRPKPKPKAAKTKAAKTATTTRTVAKKVAIKVATEAAKPAASKTAKAPAKTRARKATP